MNLKFPSFSTKYLLVVGAAIVGLVGSPLLMAACAEVEATAALVCAGPLHDEGEWYSCPPKIQPETSHIVYIPKSTCRGGDGGVDGGTPDGGVPGGKRGGIHVPVVIQFPLKDMVGQHCLDFSTARDDAGNVLGCAKGRWLKAELKQAKAAACVFRCTRENGIEVCRGNGPQCDGVDPWTSQKGR